MPEPITLFLDVALHMAWLPACLLAAVALERIWSRSAR